MTVTLETVSTMVPLLISMVLTVSVERLIVTPVNMVRLFWVTRISFVMETMAACSSVTDSTKVV